MLLIVSIAAALCALILTVAAGMALVDVERWFKGRSTHFRVWAYLPVGVVALLVGAVLTTYIANHGGSAGQGQPVTSIANSSAPSNPAPSSEPNTPGAGSTGSPTPPARASDPSTDTATTRAPSEVPTSFSVPLTNIYGGTGNTVIINGQPFDFSSSASNGRSLGDPSLVTSCSELNVTAGIRDDAAPYANGGETLEVLSGDGIAGVLTVPVRKLAVGTYPLTGGRLTFAVSGAVGIYWNGTMTCSTPSGRAGAS